MAVNKTKHKRYILNKDVYKSAGKARKRARKLGLKGIHSHGRGSGVYRRALRRKKNG